ncbi:hypothetical protein CDL15_Pgr018830 [Punica granatum]|nr:hypothetical protein CDL15_Pgr018830 [Punica granatum]
MLLTDKLLPRASWKHRIIIYLPPSLRARSSSTSVLESVHCGDSSYFWDRNFVSEALKISAKVRSILGGEQLHAAIVKFGLVDVLSLQNQILDVYVKCGRCQDAWRLFEELPVRNVVTWNTLINGLVGFPHNVKYDCCTVFSAIRRMQLESVNPDFLTFSSLLRASVECKNMGIGTQLHCFIVKYGFLQNCFVSNSLLNFYGKLGAIQNARQLFDEVKYRDLAVWNAMLSCYALEPSPRGGALRIFCSMHQEGLKGDEFTFSMLLSFCAASVFLHLGKQIHGLIVKFSFAVDVLVSSALIDMYAKNGLVDDARRTFDEMPFRNLVSWTTIIVCYGKQGNGRETMRILREMLRRDFHPDELTLSSVLTSCGNVSATSEILQLHAYLVKSRLHTFLSVSNSLISAYSKCGSIESASQCFDSFAEPDIVTWTSIICAYGFHGLAKESCEMFRKMLSHEIRPDKVAFLGVLSACSHAGLVNEGLYYFNLMTDVYGIIPDSEQYACLIDLAGRHGLLEQAYEVLSSMPELDPSTLGAFIGACKVHGNSRLAREAADRLFSLELDKSVNYTLLSNIYALEGKWENVARVRKLMKQRCEHKVPGCSWIEVSGNVHTFVSGDKSNPRSSELYDALEMFLWEVNEGSSIFCGSNIWHYKHVEEKLCD